jgi:hypothetical protein
MFCINWHLMMMLAHMIPIRHLNSFGINAICLNPGFQRKMFQLASCQVHAREHEFQWDLTQFLHKFFLTGSVILEAASLFVRGSTIVQLFSFRNDGVKKQLPPIPAWLLRARAAATVRLWPPFSLVPGLLAGGKGSGFHPLVD